MNSLRRFTNTVSAFTTIRHAIYKHQILEAQWGLLHKSYLSTTPPNTAQGNLKQQAGGGTIKQNEWSVVYRLPIIRWASAFNRLKIYQGALTIAGLPITFMLEQAQFLPPGSGGVVTAVGLSGLATLALSGLAVQNLIGFIYINQHANKLKFAYVDYWGRRQDILINVAELIPDGAQENPTRMNFFQRIGVQGNEKFKLKLLQRYGVIVKPDVFNSLFY